MEEKNERDRQSGGNKHGGGEHPYRKVSSAKCLLLMRMISDAHLHPTRQFVHSFVFVCV